MLIFGWDFESLFPQKCCHRLGFFLQLEIFRFCWIGKRYNAKLEARIVIELPFSRRDEAKRKLAWVQGPLSNA